MAETRWSTERCFWAFRAGPRQLGPSQCLVPRAACVNTTGTEPSGRNRENPMTNKIRHRNSQSGFTVLEAISAIVILSFGILSLAAVYAQGIQVANMTQLDYIAEKKAEEAVETIFAARDSHLLAWPNIRNVTGSGGTNDGVFLVGPQPLLAAGPDGLYGTTDDDTKTPDVVIMDPAPGLILGTSDD